MRSDRPAARAIGFVQCAFAAVFFGGGVAVAICWAFAYMACAGAAAPTADLFAELLPVSWAAAGGTLFGLMTRKD